MNTENPESWPDDKLLEQMREDNHMAFERIYDKYASALYYSAYNLFRDRQTCEDLVQELFVDLWMKRNDLKIRTLKSYLYKAIRNRVLMLIRSGKACVCIDVLEDLAVQYPAEDHLTEKEINRIVDQEMSGLPDRCREVFRLSRKENLSHKEIAARLNISVKTVENQVTIALRRLRSALGDFLCWLSIVINFF